MLRFLCCCCASGGNSNERQPLLHPRSPSEVNRAESARKTRPAHDSQTVKRTGRLTMRRVNVPELDWRFADMAESFNKQQEQHEAMVQHIRNLKQSWNCASTDGLTFAECIRKIRDEQQATYRISLEMKCYDFFLTVDPVHSEEDDEEQPLPRKLQLAKNEIKGLSDSAKATISKGTPLQQLIGWLLQGHSQMAEQVKAAAETFQEEGRLKENLDENIKEVKRAKELSQEYRKQAAGVFNEAAQIAGVCV